MKAQTMHVMFKNGNGSPSAIAPFLCPEEIECTSGVRFPDGLMYGWQCCPADSGKYAANSSHPMSTAARFPGQQLAPYNQNPSTQVDFNTDASICASNIRNNGYGVPPDPEADGEVCVYERVRARRVPWSAPALKEHMAGAHEVAPTPFLRLP